MNIKKEHKKIALFFIISLIVAILNGYLFDWINNSFFNYTSNQDGLSDYSPLAKFMMIVFIAPVVETALFQYLPNLVLIKLNVRSRFLLVLCPALLFGCLHYYFWLYAVMAFIAGLILNTLYLYFKDNSRYYFWMICLFHALYNLYGYLFVV
jgi:hypothetical protein